MRIGPETMLTSKQILPEWKKLMKNPNGRKGSNKRCPSCKGTGLNRQSEKGADACPRCIGWGFMKEGSVKEVNF